MFAIVAWALSKPTGEWRAALNWFSTPHDPQLQVLILLCTVAALGGLLERKRRTSSAGADPEPSRGTPH